MKLNTTALIRATTLVIWLIVGLTIGAEKSAPFKAFLAKVGGHHWVGKGILAVAAFCVLYVLFRRAKESDNVLRGAFIVWGSVVLGGVIIFGFYIQHFLTA